MKPRGWPAAITLLLLLPLLPSCGKSKSGRGKPPVGTLEVVATLPVCPGSLTVTGEGRIFAGIHPFRPGPARLIEVLPPDGYRPWPNESWNGNPGSGPDVFNAVAGVQADDRGRLWVLDSGWSKPPRPPKLLAFDVKSGRLRFRHDFREDVAGPKSALNDLAVDAERGFIYIADTGGDRAPSLVVVDTRFRQSWRILNAHEMLLPEEVDLVVGGRVLKRPGPGGESRPVRVGVNTVTLSADGRLLYYGALNGQTWWEATTTLLRSGESDAAIERTVKRIGIKPLSSSASADLEGNHYFANPGASAIDVFPVRGRIKRLVQDERLAWPAALSFGPDGWLYTAANRLHLSPPFNEGREGASPPYEVLRVWTGKEGIPGR